MALPQALNVADYFTLAAASDVKLELVDGVIVAMSGGLPVHALLAMRLGRAIGNRLRASCEVYSSDLRVAVNSKNYFYPDLTVVCGKVETLPHRADTATNPLLVVEVLSKSTESFDRGTKLQRYVQVPSVKGILFVSSREPALELYERNGDTWTWTSRAEGTLRIGCLDLELDLNEVYEGIPFEPVDLPKSAELAED